MSRVGAFLQRVFGVGDINPPARRPDRRNWTDPSQPPSISDFDLDLAYQTALSQEQGRFRLPSQMFKAIDRDDRCMSCLNTRELAVQAIPELFLDPPDGRDTARARKALERDWPSIFPKSLQGEVIRNIAVMGFCIGRLNNWQEPTPTMTIWDPYYVDWDWGLNRFTVQAQWVTEKGIREQGTIPVTPGDGNWVLFTGRNKTKPFLGGLIRVLPQLIVFRQSNMIDWSRHGKKWGNPPIVVESTSVQATKVKDYQKLAADLSELVGDSVITLPNGAKMTLLELSRDAWRVFSSFGPDFLDDCIAIAILGQNLTTRVTAGSFAAALAHQFVRLDYMKGDCMSLGDTSHRQIAYPYYCYKHQIYDLNKVPVPYWDSEPPPDKRVVAEAAKNAGEAWSAMAKGIRDLEAVGIEVDRERACEDFDIPVKQIKDLPKVNPAPAMPDGKPADDPSADGAPPDQEA